MALALWETKRFLPRQLAILIMDAKQLNATTIEALATDMAQHTTEEQLALIDWLMANQLLKDKKLTTLVTSWEHHALPLLRRVFWYYQARLRWMGNTNHSNTERLLESITQNLLHEAPEVQWAMNYTAGQIGKWDAKYRAQCIQIGEQTGLYKDEKVPKNCTPSYLPAFIAIEVEKLKK